MGCSFKCTKTNIANPNHYATPNAIYVFDLIRTTARNKVITASTSMRNLSGNGAARIDYNAISAGLATVIDTSISHEGKLIVRARDAIEGEAFVVVIHFGISIRRWVN